MIKRFKTAFDNESGVSTLEIVVLLSIFIVLSGLLMACFVSTVGIGTMRSDFTRGTGWFRNNSSNTAIFRSEWVKN